MNLPTPQPSIKGRTPSPPETPEPGPAPADRAHDLTAARTHRTIRVSQKASTIRLSLLSKASPTTAMLPS
ncbi:hypothetical protein ACWKT5_34810 [Streptomyces avermitilis]